MHPIADVYRHSSANFVLGETVPQRLSRRNQSTIRVVIENPSDDNHVSRLNIAAREGEEDKKTGKFHLANAAFTFRELKNQKGASTDLDLPLLPRIKVTAGNEILQDYSRTCIWVSFLEAPDKSTVLMAPTYRKIEGEPGETVTLRLKGTNISRSRSR